VPGVGKTFFGVILAAISDASSRASGRADLQPTEVVSFQMINPATGASASPSSVRWRRPRSSCSTRSTASR
jgi:hypothetical protein